LKYMFGVRMSNVHARCLYGIITKKLSGCKRKY